MLRIALPLVLAEVGWMSMSIVDTVMVGHLPNAATAISAAALSQVFFNMLVFGIGGILLGLDTTVAQAHGAGRFDEANRWLYQGILLAVAISGLLMMIFAVAPFGMSRLHTDPEVLKGALGTLGALSLGTLPLMLYFTLRRYLQAFNHVRIIAAALVSANLVNILFDWLLIYGHRWSLTLAAHTFVLAIPMLGVVGSGISTSLSRAYQAVFLIAALLYVNRKHDYGLLRVSLAPHWPSIRRLLALGLPSGATILIEIAIFTVVTNLIATLGSVPLAGHEIALNCIAFTFMIPLGLSAAASIRVGQAIGRRSLPEARAAGWTAIGLGAIFMLFSSLLFIVAPHRLASAFTHDPSVIAAAVPLLLIASIFQFCDGLQVTAIGALRGAGNTHSGLITHLCSYWLVGLPLGIYLCFHQHMGARGLWLGLCAALVIAGIVLILLWRRQLRLISV
ncbi:MATE family efflux transporter [Granulicella sp. WH15]|uniref:MATE family efflux transporter n=1 Tax=Granulicella sp. WH15 TaxID=2602070 RepID=UPI002105D2BF|nr:MATE family efflux transporter [Granulicella sp. WH15]